MIIYSNSSTDAENFMKIGGLVDLGMIAIWEKSKINKKETAAEHIACLSCFQQ